MKLFKVLVAALVMVGMALPVIAEDRLQLSGEMRTRAFYTNYDIDDAPDFGTQTWANQRLRIAGKIAVAEGVSVTFRTDITEGTNWGDSSTFFSGANNPERSNGFGHARSGSQQQWDRAHMDLTKGMFHLRAGQQFVGTGGTWAIDTQDSGLALDIKTSVPVNVFFIVDKDGASKDIEDSFLFGGSLSPKGDNFSAKIFGAGYHDDDGGSGLGNEEVYLLGLQGSTNLSAVKLFGEFDYFTGDVNNDVDAFGAQLFLDASVAATDALTVGGQFYYADGDDEDVQYVRLGNGFNGWDPIMDVGTSLSNEEITLGQLMGIDGNPFDFTGESAGVIGGRLYGNFKLSDTLSFGASAAYLTVQEDKNIDVDEMVLAGGMVYKVLDNTSFQLQLQYQDGTVKDTPVGDIDFDAVTAGTGLFVTF
jgi:hypothetical protein